MGFWVGHALIGELIMFGCFSAAGPVGSLRFDSVFGYGDVDCGGVVDLWDYYQLYHVFPGGAGFLRGKWGRCCLWERCGKGGIVLVLVEHILGASGGWS